MKKITTLLLVAWFSAGCVSTDPYMEYALARSALARAQESSADKFFPKSYLKAKFLYKKGAIMYEKQNHEEARNSFEESIKLAERAEFKARIKKRKESE